MTNRYQTTSVIVVLAALTGCGHKTDGSVIATVNGHAISSGQFDAYLKLKRIPGDDAARRQHALDEYLEREALTDVIESEKTLDKAALDAELHEYEKELVISRYFDKVLADKVSDDAVRNYYSANAAKYEERKVHAAHILFRTRPGMSEQERKAKLTAAQEAYGKLKKGDDFGSVAQAMSEDRVSGTKGGDLGWLREGSIDPRFSQKVFAMKADELSEPFETTFGFHVVKLLEPAQTVKKPFEAVQGDIRYQLRAETKKAEMDRLQAKAKVERNEKAATPGKPGSELHDQNKQATASK